MLLDFKERFYQLWTKYFPGAELPIGFYYTDRADDANRVRSSKGWRCVFSDLARVRRGESLYLDEESVGCGGGRRYLGFVQDVHSDFEHFLSYGIPGRVEGERYKKTPELVREYAQHLPPFQAPGRYIVFKRWDQMDLDDDPDVFIFFARPDVLSGLFTLANFETVDSQAVIAPFASGCGSIVEYPFIESKSQQPRAVLGTFDVSARPYVGPDVLTFAVPWAKFRVMVDNAEESFLITGSWDKVKKRIQKNN